MDESYTSDFEFYESDADSILLLGQPIENLLSLEEMGADPTENSDFHKKYHDHDDDNNNKNNGNNSGGEEYGDASFNNDDDDDDDENLPVVHVLASITEGDDDEEGDESHGNHRKTTNSNKSRGNSNYIRINVSSKKMGKPKNWRVKKSSNKIDGTNENNRNRNNNEFSNSNNNNEYFEQQDNMYLQQLSNYKNSIYDGGHGHFPVSSTSAITSHVSSDMRHPAAIMKKQLDIAMKRIKSYSKERAILLARLDSSSIVIELEKLRTIISEQEGIIQGLVEDKKGLQKIARHQSKRLEEQEIKTKNISSNSDSVTTAEGQIKILLERVRRVTMKLTEVRAREKYLMMDNEYLNKQITRYKNRIAFLMKSKEFSSTDDNNNNNNNNSPISDASNKDKQQTIPPIQKTTSSPKGSDKFPVDTKMKNKNDNLESKATASSKLAKSDDGTSDISSRFSNFNRQDLHSPIIDYSKPLSGSTDYVDVISKLQRSLKIQRTSFFKEVSSLKNEIEKLKNKNKQIEGELENREKDARSQVITVKQLRQTCQDLAEGNRRLQLASVVYSNFEQASNNPPYTVQLQPQPPPILSRPTTPGSRRQKPLKPKGPLIDEGHTHTNSYNSFEEQFSYSHEINYDYNNNNSNNNNSNNNNTFFITSSSQIPQVDLL